jgi:DNA-binding MltR family transcriptional regulator
MRLKKRVPVEQLSEDTRRLFEVLNDESDLACVVIGAAFLETTVATLLERKFLTSAVAGKLLEPGGALGSFAPRTDLAYCLGLITKDHYQDLCTIAEIRNRVAHSHLQLDFRDSGIRAACDQLHEWRIVLVGEEEAPLTDATETDLAARARNQFKLTVAFLANRLLLTTLGLRAPEPSNIRLNPPAAPSTGPAAG